MTRKPLPALGLTLAVSLAVSAPLAAHATDIVVATVNNGHMIEMQKLTHFFEQANPDIHVKWVTLEEGVLRQRATTDIATQGGQFDVMTIGMLETPIWGKKGWLQDVPQGPGRQGRREVRRPSHLGPGARRRRQDE